MMIFFSKIYKNNVLIIMLIYITAYKDFTMYNLHYFKIKNEHKITYINFLKLCSFNFIFSYNENMYSSLLKCIHLINNLLIFHMFSNLCFHIVINMKHIKKIYNFKKHLKNCVHKCKFIISDYKI